jgi:hypothetical protein
MENYLKVIVMLLKFLFSWSCRLFSLPGKHLWRFLKSKMVSDCCPPRRTNLTSFGRYATRFANSGNNKSNTRSKKCEAAHATVSAPSEAWHFL